MSSQHLETQRQSQRLCWLQNILASLAFAIAGYSVAAVILSSGGNPNLQFSSFYAAGAAFLSALIIWPKDFGASVAVLRGTTRGLLIGVVSIPIMVSIILLLMAFVDDRWNLDNALESPGGILAGAAMFFLWGTFCAMIGVGWLTALFGALAGFIIAGTIRMTDAYLSNRTNKNDSETNMPLHEYNQPEHLELLNYQRSRRRLAGAFISIAVVSLIAIPAATIALETSAQHAHQKDVIIDTIKQPGID